MFEVCYDRARNTWVVTRTHITLTDGKTFAPANLRAAAEDANYRALIDYYIANKYTLRYTGIHCMVDVVYIVYVCC